MSNGQHTSDIIAIVQGAIIEKRRGMSFGREFSTHKMDAQGLHCIYTKISQTKYSISALMRDLKGKSVMMTCEKHSNFKYKFYNRHLGAIGYYVSTVGLNEATIAKYIKEQEKQDQIITSLGTKEYEGPFKGQDK